MSKLFRVFYDVIVERLPESHFNQKSHKDADTELFSIITIPLCVKNSELGGFSSS